MWGFAVTSAACIRKPGKIRARHWHPSSTFQARDFNFWLSWTILFFAEFFDTILRNVWASGLVRI